MNKKNNIINVEKTDVENTSGFFAGVDVVEGTKENINLIVERNISVSALEELFKTGEYDLAILSYHNVSKKSYALQDIFLTYSKDEDFEKNVDSKDNYLLNIYGISSEKTLNLILKRLLGVGNNNYAQKLEKLILKKEFNINLENTSNLKNIGNIMNNISELVLEKLNKNISTNKSKILSLNSSLSFDELIKVFKDEYRFIKYNTQATKKTFLDAIKQFVSSLELSEDIKNEILTLLNIYKKIGVIHVLDNLAYNKNDIKELQKLEQKEDDIYLTVELLQKSYPVLYNIFRNSISDDNISRKWDRYVEKVTAFIDKYGLNYFKNTNKLKESISQLAYRDFQSRYKKYENTLSMLDRNLAKVPKNLLKYTSFIFGGNEFKLSVRTRELYYLLSNDYKVGVEFFANKNKSNLSIFLFLALADKKDIEEQSFKIINYYTKRFSTRFQTELSKKSKVSMDFGGGIGKDSLSIDYVYEIITKTLEGTDLSKQIKNILVDADIDIAGFKNDKLEIIEKKPDKLLKENKELNIIKKLQNAFENGDFDLVTKLLEE